VAAASTVACAHDLSQHSTDEGAEAEGRRVTTPAPPVGGARRDADDELRAPRSAHGRGKGRNYLWEEVEGPKKNLELCC
jgi:hypothetical protein